MSRKVYQAVAEALNRSRPSKDEYQYASKRVQWDIDCTVVSLAFGDLNADFDSEKFLEACRSPQN